MLVPTKESSSFRDPDGFIFYRNDNIYRQINLSYGETYEQLIQSGLYNKLVGEKLLIPHQELVNDKTDDPRCYKVLQPERINFISYPYEWSFSILKEAALLTIKIQQIAIDYGLSLKDASAYNIQFHNGSPIFIDTLSFEKFTPKPWIAYKQFCQHFLAPLLIMSKVDIRLNSLLQLYLNGIPIDLASKLLPFKSYFDPKALLHIHLHAKSQQHYSNRRVDLTGKELSSNSIRGLLDSLYTGIKSLNLRRQKTEWGSYYSNTNYNEAAMRSKHEIVYEYISEIKPHQLLDIGGNQGNYSLPLKDTIETLIVSDIDPNAIEKCYQFIKSKSIKNVYSIVTDITNPFPGIGWNNQERKSLLDRLHGTDTILALAIIHHLAITHNLQFEQIAQLFSEIAPHLIVEFIPKDDSNTQILLQNRDDIFTNYNQTSFEQAFTKTYEIIHASPVVESKRTLYLMKRH